MSPLKTAVSIALFASPLATAQGPMYLDCFLEVESKVTAVYRVAVSESPEQVFFQQEGGLFYQVKEVDFSATEIEFVIGEHLKRRFTIQRADMHFSHEIEHNVGTHRSEGECWSADVSERL